VVNTLAYYRTATITVVKSFIVLTPESEVFQIHLNWNSDSDRITNLRYNQFTTVSYDCSIRIWGRTRDTIIFFFESDE
jgi:hypothetical protein